MKFDLVTPPYQDPGGPDYKPINNLHIDHEINQQKKGTLSTVNERNQYGFPITRKTNRRKSSTGVFATIYRRAKALLLGLKRKIRK